MKYGLPYKGSKNKLAERIVRLLPRADHLIDLFCGGCAVTHAALVMGKYPHCHINDVNWMCPQLFTDALAGRYNDETRWISREDFERLKDTDPYVAVVWSFGNNLRDYLYSREIEPLKKAIHYAMFFHDYTLARDLGHDLSFIEPITDLQRRYLAVKHYFEGKMNERMQSFEGGGQNQGLQLESYNRTQRLRQSQTPELGGKTLAQHQYKRPSELQHLEGINRVSEFKKKKISETIYPDGSDSDNPYHYSVHHPVSRLERLNAIIAPPNRTIHLSPAPCLTTPKSPSPKAA